MENEKLPIKFFAPREIDELRVEPGRSSDIPNWVLSGDELEQRASALKLAFEQFASRVIDREKRKSAVPFVFVAKMSSDATAKSRRGDMANHIFAPYAYIFLLLYKMDKALKAVPKERSM